MYIQTVGYESVLKPNKVWIHTAWVTPPSVRLAERWQTQKARPCCVRTTSGKMQNYRDGADLELRGGRLTGMVEFGVLMGLPCVLIAVAVTEGCICKNS